MSKLKSHLKHPFLLHNHMSINICLYLSFQNFTQAMTEVDMPSQFLSSYCLLGLYITELLTSAYGFPVNTTKIFVGDKINNQKIGK